MSTTPPGWHHDPWRQAPMRWWDGTHWTEHTADWSGNLGAAPVARGPGVGAHLLRERAITPWLRALLYLWPVAVALSLGGIAASVSDLSDGGDSGGASAVTLLGQLGGLVGIAVLVLRIIWLYRAATVARDLGLPARRQPMHSAIGWLVPIINYWWPYQGLTDLFPEARRPDRRIAWWWVTSIVSQFTLLIAVVVPFVAGAVAVVLVAAALVPAVAAAALEAGLVGDAVTLHTELAGAVPAP